MLDLKKYKYMVIRLRSRLTWEEYVSTLFFIKRQERILKVEGRAGCPSSGFAVDVDLVTLVLSYNTKILMKINDNIQDPNIANLISANRKIYKILFELTSFKVDIFSPGLEGLFCTLRTKERARLLKLVDENCFLFPNANLKNLQDMDLNLRENKPEAINYFNEINSKINLFLRDKSF